MKKLMFSLGAFLLVAALPAFAQKSPSGGGNAPDPPSLCDGIAGNLVANCGFETGSFSSWTIANGNANFIGSNCSGGGPTGCSNTGDHFAALGNVGSDATISQTITDVAGQTYTFSFFYGTDGGQTQDFSASFGGTLLYSESADSLAPGTWTQFSFTVTGTGSDTISFTERNDPSYDGLDDVVLAGPVPEPSSIILFGSMLLGVGIVLKRRRTA